MNLSERKVALVCNPMPLENAKALGVTDRIAKILSEKKCPFSIFTVAWPKVWDNYTEAWVIGGDGTLNQFINQNPDFLLPITIFKGGSGNDFHWMIYGDITIEEQVEKVLNGAPHPVDAGSCNGSLFLNGLGIGFDGAIVKDLVGKKKVAGKASYLLSILKHILRHREERCDIEADGFLVREDCFMISVANSKRYGGGFNVAPHAVVDDGLLDISIITKISPLKRMQFLPVIEKGEHLSLPFVQYNQVKNVTIKCKNPLPAHLDGEFLVASEFEVRCLKKRFSFLW